MRNYGIRRRHERRAVTYNITLPAEFMTLAMIGAVYFGVGIIVALLAGGASFISVMVMAFFWPLVAIWFLLTGLLKFALIATLIILAIVAIVKILD